MADKLEGIPLSRFEEPIQEALANYEVLADSGLTFDPVPASRLQLTPDKPNSARSVSDARYLGEKIGNLYVIAFKPGDGTGDESSHKLSELDTTPYPRETRVIPRAKTGVHHEIHMTLAAHEIDNVHADPVLFQGYFDLLGLDHGRVLRIGSLGRPFVLQPDPVATYTVGFYQPDGPRFGDPHAVYSALRYDAQVCAFLAVGDELDARHPLLLGSLDPKLPFDKN